MTHILAVETSGLTCGACVTINGSLTSVSELYRANVHENFLEHCVSNALQMANIGLENINVLAVSAGPGSFTGLRIGLSYVKGLCFDGAIPMLGIDTLQSLAWASREVAIAARHDVIHCLIPSHRDLFYIGSYSVTDEGIVPITSEIELVTLDECRRRTAKGLVCGPGAVSVLVSAAPPISGLTRLSSRFVALAAWHRLQKEPGGFDDSSSFEPLYRQEWAARTV